MDVTATIDELRTSGEVWVTGPVRVQRRVASEVLRRVPGAHSEMLDPVTGIRAYTDPTPGTETRIFIPPAPSQMASMGSITPSR